MQSLASFTAATRFGLGPSPTDPDWLHQEPVGWLLAQIQPGLPTPHLDGYRSSGAILRDVLGALRLTDGDARREANMAILRDDLRPELMDRFRTQVTTETPFAERLVRFWSNHFTVSNVVRVISPATTAFEREAIRPFIFGRFAEMLRASSRHPCMLTYLDNIRSVGPNSPQGRRQMQRQGLETTLNENLAREILELHTLGVNGGYTQDDVIEFAKAITGWGHSGLVGRDAPLPRQITFAFNEAAHEPGPKTVLGRRYPEAGDEEGVRILNVLAHHPSTARHIATKLARHFIADDPPPEAVETLTNVFLETGGNLAEVTRALVLLDAPWNQPLSKIKTHEEFVISVHRLAGLESLQQREVMEPLRELNQQPFSAPSPAGWSDRGPDWIGPEALMMRIDWARRYATTLPPTLSPDEVLQTALGPMCSEDTRTWVSRAASGDEALAMIFVSPEFQRR